MHGGIAITKDIHWIGVNDRETDLFEAIWPLPRGVSYNTYCVVDQKTALIDTVKSAYFPQFLEKIRSILGEGRTIDYLVINHMEPDHSGAVKVLRESFPDVTIVGNAKTKELLANFYGLTENFLVVKDGEDLDLGSHKLRFHFIPMVHWPETMVCYDETDKVLFSSDAFGGFGSLDGGVFDDEVDMSYYEDEILRYFSNIVGRYSFQVQKAIKKVRTLDLNVIAPAHGPILRKSPWHVVDLYDKWSRHDAEKGVVVVYGSMYGNTKAMAEAIARALAEEGIEKVILHDISRSHVSFVIRDVWKFRGLVLASCTYNTELFPPMQALTSALQNKMLKNRVLGVCGSYSWSKGALAALLQFGEKGDWEIVGPHVEVCSAPTQEDFARCRELGRNIAAVL